MIARSTLLLFWLHAVTSIADVTLSVGSTAPTDRVFTSHPWLNTQSGRAFNWESNIVAGSTSGQLAYGQSFLVPGFKSVLLDKVTIRVRDYGLTAIGQPFLFELWSFEDEGDQTGNERLSLQTGSIPLDLPQSPGLAVNPLYWTFDVEDIELDGGKHYGYLFGFTAGPEPERFVDFAISFSNIYPDGRNVFRYGPDLEWGSDPFNIIDSTFYLQSAVPELSVIWLSCMPIILCVVARSIRRARSRVCSTLGVTLLFLVSVDNARAEVSFQTLYSLTESDGRDPLGGLAVVGSTLYGTTNSTFSVLPGSGAYANGSVFSINRDGSNFQTIHSFSSSEGYPPAAGVIASGGKLYGTIRGSSFFISGAGPGAVFSLNLDGSGYQTLHTFNDSFGPGPPQAGLTVVGTTLYGTTYGLPELATDGYYGTVFGVNFDGSGFHVVHDFDDPFPINGGQQPWAGVTAVESTLYGATDRSVFKVQLDGSGFQTLHAFNEYLFGDLTVVGSKLYGTTSYSGSLVGDGTVFSMNLDGSGFQTLHSFNGLDGQYPFGKLTAIGSTLYGTTRQGGASDLGSIFAINLDGSNFQTLHSFSGLDGRLPGDDLTALGSTLYGTTSSGGLHDRGTVFAIAIPEASSLVLGGTCAGCLGTLVASRLHRRKRTDMTNRDSTQTVD